VILKTSGRRENVVQDKRKRRNMTLMANADSHDILRPAEQFAQMIAAALRQIIADKCFKKLMQRIV
jgi:hypothetical protein